MSDSRILKDFFTNSIAESDPKIADAIRAELIREQKGIELIASENIVSKAVMEAQGTVLTNKYAEGYPGKRYYGGCREVDRVEVLAIERLKKIFGAAYANVQAHSGSNANEAAFMVLAKPGDTILGMSLAAGGHLTHGAAPNFSGKWFHSVQYGVCKDSGLLDYDEVEQLAKEHKPKLIIAGASAYPRYIDFPRFRSIADSVGAKLMIDMAHFAGLVAAGLHPTPIPYADIVTSTTHKTMRGPRGGFILTNDEGLFKRINSAIFPGLQGGPLMHVLAAKAVSFGEALRPEFKLYQMAVKENAAVLADGLLEKGFDIVTGGTDNHIVLVDLRPKKITGHVAEQALERAGITVNKNSVPFDPEKPSVTSGIRLGSPAATSRGFGKNEFRQIAEMIDEVLTGLSCSKNPEDNAITEKKVMTRVNALCCKFPIYEG